MPLEVGSRIAHYDVTALIGEGGMGQVYQATDTKLNRQVALKEGAVLAVDTYAFRGRRTARAADRSDHGRVNCTVIIHSVGG